RSVTAVDGVASASTSAQANGGTTSQDADVIGDLDGVAATPTVQNTIIKLIGGTFSNLGNNLIAVDPMLGPLQANGGPTPTRLPLPGSPAIDAGNNAAASGALDQRGLNRIVNGTIDIGAVETQPDALNTLIS